MTTKRIITLTIAILATGLLLGGCKKKVKNQATQAGYPAWVSDACYDCEEGEMAGFGRSDVAAVDFNTAKGEAEAMALAHVGQQLQTEVDYLMEVAAEVFTDIEPDQLVDLGNRTRKQMDMNYVHQSVRGAEFVDYLYLPNLDRPESILVRAKVSVEREALANDLLGAFGRELDALEAELELNHEENMLRLERVREDYLNRQGS